jgi:Glycosyltransferase family 28 C-terminal domain
MCSWNLLNTLNFSNYPHGMENARAGEEHAYGRITPMKKIHIVFHDAGGGHRNAAVSLKAVLEQQQKPWQVELVQFQELTDQLDVLRKLTRIRIQDLYNTLLQNGWTLGSKYLLRILQATIRAFHRPMVNLLEKIWRENPADLLISVIPHFNREICESWTGVYPGRPFVTIITDFADFPPRFWIEPMKEQIIIGGTARVIEQASAMGKNAQNAFRVSGMIVRPEFYTPDDIDRATRRRELNLQPDVPTGVVLFGGHGSKVMYDIAERLEAAHFPLQLLLICGRNEKLAARLRARKWNLPVRAIGFSREVHRLMRASDFLIGKPGPGSIAEAMVSGLPVLLECNAWTLPQERYNTQWVKEQRVGIVLRSFRDVADGVQEMIQLGRLAELKKNVAALKNRALFEIPDLLANLLDQSFVHGTLQEPPIAKLAV